MKQNPYSMTFGKAPAQLIGRLAQTNEIRDAFFAETPPYQVYMITGVRGAGKTVMLSELSREMSETDGWIVADLSPERDILHALASRLYAHPEIYPLIQKAKINFSALGLGVSIDNQPPVTDVESALDILLDKVARRKKRLLITLDEVTSNKEVREFVSAFQIFLRHDHPVFLLMTGLYDKIYDLQNEDTLTFLYRAPKIELAPLNQGAVTRHYMDTLRIDRDKAGKMAQLVKGYPFAFQVLGFLAWKYGAGFEIDDLLDDFDLHLSEFVYDKIWSELSPTDRSVLTEVSKRGTAKVQDIREVLQLTSSMMSVYRDRLKKKGLVDTRDYGMLSLTLPRFDVFALNHES